MVVGGKFFADGPTFSAIHGEGSAVGQAIEGEVCEFPRYVVGFGENKIPYLFLYINLSFF